MVNLFGRIGRAFRRAVEKGREIGERVVKKGREVGERIVKGVKEVGSRISSKLHDINKAAAGISKFLGLDKVAERVGNALRQLESDLLSVIPEPAQPIVAKIYRMTPVGKVSDAALYSADVLSGKKELLSNETLRQIFPKYDAIINEIDATKGLVGAQKNQSKAAARRAATKLAVATFKVLTS